MITAILPDGFKHILQDRLYLESLFDGSLYKIVGKENALGRRMFLGPVCVEYYTCDQEPELLPYKGLRCVIWSRVTRIDRPVSWLQPFSTSSREVCAYIDIKNCDAYYKNWRDTFKTYYNRFATQTKYIIQEVTCEEFCRLYKQHAKERSLVVPYLKQIKKLSSLEKSTIHMYLLRNTETNDVVAGVATVDCFSVEQSFYIAAFTRKDIAPKESGLWLCNFWMKESSKRGILYANFGNVWTPGKPASWKGFSNFKMKFNPKLITLKPELIRFTFYT